MNTRTSTGLFLTVAIAAVLVLAARNVPAQDSTPTSAAQTAPVQLSYGVPQIIQLSKAKVSENTIVAYIQNSGTIYSLNASEIVYLKQQGVSDAVLTTMLNQRQRVTQAAAQTAPQAPATVTMSQPGSPDARSAETSTVVAQPTVTYVQTVPSSTVYVIPDTQTYQYYNNYYPAYGCYPYYSGWYYPPVSFSFGFGGGYRGGYYHGGWGGGYRGGYHGGWGGGYRGGYRGGGGWHR
ncbi:MAG: hypothetical protein ABSC89_10555 [Verrucomicrobiota bacterium]|jgi:hypothetical protein